MHNNNYSHLIGLGDQARNRIAAGEPTSNLVSLLPGNQLSEGIAWTYPHAENVFALDQAATWTTERVAEFEAQDHEHVEAAVRHQQRQEATLRKAAFEQERRGAMTDDERLVESAILCSPQFRAFVANRTCCA
jgi:hypothetical protein